MSYDKFMSLKTPAIYHRERAFFTELVDPAGARHWFGGNFDLNVTGLPDGPNPLHRVLTIDLTDELLDITPPQDLEQVPLVFGIRIEACEMTYLVTPARQITTKRGWGLVATDGWPYPNYPDALPRLGLRLIEPVPCTLDEFGEFTHQGLDLAEPDEMIIVVPSIESYGGVSLFGEHGWGVQMIFYITTADRTVHVTHQIG